MKAIIWTDYGSPDGLQLEEIEKVSPKEDEILVKVFATTVTAGDCEMRRLELPLMLSFPMRIYAGLLRPKRIRILGQELAGVVEQVGKNVNSYKVGDKVFGTTGFGFGAYAEYICLPVEPDDAQGVIASKPVNLSYEESAAIPTAGLEALHFLRKANIGAGKKVLVIGGGGSIGTFAIQLARHFGAEITAVDHTSKLDLMLSLGADHAIDYTKEDYTKSNQAYDLIIDVVGRNGVDRRLKLLKQEGNYFLAYAGFRHILLSVLISLISRKKLRIESANQNQEDLLFLKDLTESGELKSIIDRSFPLERMAEAHRYAEEGHKKGNIAITVRKTS